MDFWSQALLISYDQIRAMESSEDSTSIIQALLGSRI